MIKLINSNKFIIPLIFFIVLYVVIIPFNDYTWHWDDSIYLGTTQKYMSGKFFIYEHFPLGLLIIALSGKLFGMESYERLTHYYKADSELPYDLHFLPLRILPMLIGCMIPISIYFISLNLTKSKILSFSIFSLIIFDNSQVALYRMVMLDQVLLLLETWIIFLYIKILKAKVFNPRINIVYGTIFGLFLCTKLSVVPFALLLFPYTLKYLSNVRKYLYIFIPLVISNLSIWIIHFSIATKYDSLVFNILRPHDFGLSQIQVEWIKNNQILNPYHLMTFIISYIKYSLNFHSTHAPKFELYNLNSGSNPLTWFYGGTSSVSYVNAINNLNPKNILYTVLAIQANPFTYLVVFSFVAVIAIMYINKFALKYDYSILNNKIFNNLAFTYVTYLYMFVFAPRMVYLYHYFPLLIISYFLIMLFYDFYKNDVPLKNINFINRLCLQVSVISFISFMIYCPYTYSLPMNFSYFTNTQLFQSWKITPRVIDLFLKLTKNTPDLLYINDESFKISERTLDDLPIKQSNGIFYNIPNSNIIFLPTKYINYKVEIVGTSKTIVSYIKELKPCIKINCDVFNITQQKIDYIYILPHGFTSKYNLHIGSQLKNNIENSIDIPTLK